MTRAPSHDGKLAWQALLGVSAATATPGQRQRLARGLPLAVERYRCRLESVPAERLHTGLRKLWALAQPRSNEPALTQWPALANACLVAADLLSLTLEKVSEPRPLRLGATKEMAEEALEAYRLEEGAPVYVLVGGSAPIRVFRTPHLEGDTPPADTRLIAHCRSLIGSLLGGGQDVVWGLERDVEGPSSMAGLVLREMIARWPEATRSLTALGITGELDARGLAVAVGDVEDKVDRFFADFPFGVCLVPASQLVDTRKALAGGMRSSFTSTSLLHGYRGVVDLLVRLGVTLPALPITQLFARLRERSRTAMDWKRRPRPAEQIVELSVTSPKGHTLKAGDVVATLARTVRRGASVVGEAGSGKSMFLRRLHHELLEGDARWNGPSLRVDGRSFGPGTSLASLVAGEAGAPWSTHAVDEFLRAPELAGSLWLLVDGVDEAPDSTRAELLRELSGWPGHFVLTSRPLRDELPGLRLEMNPLDILQQEELLELEGRKDLIQDLALPWKGPEPEEAPVGALLHDLLKSPFGVSLVAALARPGRFEGVSKRQLLAEALRDMVHRAMVEQRLDADLAVLFETRGERQLGAAAWAMLREARAELRSEDFDSLPGEAVPALIKTLERSGMAQRVGVGRWAFNHKSFAEHCAARYLLSRGPDEAVTAVLVALGGPGVEEVLLHVAADLPREPLRGLLEGLLSWKRSLSALTLATRVLLEVEPSRLESPLATRILERRLRLLTWLPSTPLPGGAGRDAGTWRALNQLAKAGILGPSEARQLLEACHPEVQERLQKRRNPMEPGWSERWPLADRLVQLLPMELPTPVLLGLEDGPKRLIEQRGRGAWALTELLPHLEDEDWSLAAAARAAWVECAPIEALLEHLELLSNASPDLMEPLLTAVLEHGSEQHKKEALLRAVVPQVSFRYWHEDREQWVEAPLRELAGLSSEEWMALWNWAWATGALGGAEWERPALERLYTHYLHDSHGSARWRAVRALRNLRAGSAKNPSTATALPIAELETLLLHEPLPEVRMQAMALLHEADVEIPLARLWPSLVTPHDLERWVAWSIALHHGWNPGLEELVYLLMPYLPGSVEPKPGEHRAEEPHWKTEAFRQGDAARRHLQDEARRRCQRPGDVELLLELAKQERLHETVDDLLGFLLTLPANVWELLVREGSQKARVWAVRRLGGWQFDRGGTERELLVPLVDDANPEVAGIAREALERQYKQREFLNRVPAGAWADEDSVRGFDLFKEERERVPDLAPLKLSELPGFTHFDALWSELERRPLPLKGARDMVAAYTDEAVDWLVRLAGEAEGRNLQVLGPVLDRLSTLFRPELLPQLVDALDHPRLGYLASELLRRHPPGRLLLPAFERSETAAVRAAWIAQKTALAPAALDAFVDSVAHGPWKKREKRRGALLTEAWTQALHSLGGLEGLIQVLQREAPAGVRTELLEYIDRNRNELVVRLAAGPRTQVAEWARTTASREGVPDTRASALRLLALLGTREDAKAWGARLDVEALPAPITVAALELIARLGSPEQVVRLERMLSHPEPEVVAAALEAMAAWANPERLLQLLREPPAAFQDESGRPRVSLYLKTWSGELARGVVQRGTREQALELAWVMRDDAGAWQFARDEGRLPEHALLVLGHVRHDPGDSVMPASVTGTGDEVFSSDVPETAAAVIGELARKLGRAEVVSVLIEGVLREDDPNVRDFLKGEIDSLGGPAPGDAPRLLRYLQEWPDSGTALELLAKTGAGERELVELWARLGVAWWPEPDTAPDQGA